MRDDDIAKRWTMNANVPDAGQTVCIDSLNLLAARRHGIESPRVTFEFSRYRNLKEDDLIYGRYLLRIRNQTMPYSHRSRRRVQTETGKRLHTDAGIQCNNSTPLIVASVPQNTSACTSPIGATDSSMVLGSTPLLLL